MKRMRRKWNYMENAQSNATRNEQNSHLLAARVSERMRENDTLSHSITHTHTGNCENECEGECSSTGCRDAFDFISFFRFHFYLGHCFGCKYFSSFFSSLLLLQRAVFCVCGSVKWKPLAWA